MGEEVVNFCCDCPKADDTADLIAALELFVVFIENTLAIDTRLVRMRVENAKKAIAKESGRFYE